MICRCWVYKRKRVKQSPVSEASADIGTEGDACDIVIEGKGGIRELEHLPKTESWHLRIRRVEPLLSARDLDGLIYGDLSLVDVSGRFRLQLCELDDLLVRVGGISLVDRGEEARKLRYNRARH